MKMRFHVLASQEAAKRSVSRRYHLEERLDELAVL